MAVILFLYILWLLLVLFLTRNKRFGLRQGKVALIISILILATIGAMISPKANYDLSRHYAEYPIIRNTKMNFWNYIFHSRIITNKNYRHAYTFNGIRFILSKNLPKEALPFFSILLCYGCWGYILDDIRKKNKLTNGLIGWAMLILNSFLPIVYIYSGIRNEMAMAIMALAIYLRIYKNCNIIKFGILAFLAVTMHPLVLVAIPLLFLRKIRPGKKSVLLIILIPQILHRVMEYFRMSKIDFLKYLGAKFYNYTYIYVYSQGKFFWFAAIMMTLMVLILSLTIKCKQEQADKSFINFLVWYSVFALANIQSYQIVMRLPYLFGILSPVIVNVLFQKENYSNWKKYELYAVKIMMALIGGYSIYSNFMWML